MSKQYPKVVLIGRTNVGKSALFNRLSDDARSIVFDNEGVTRDYIHEVVSWKGKNFDLIDAGGLPLGKQHDPILQEVQAGVIELIDSADLILFVCDGTVGALNDDRRIAKILHKSGKPTTLLINKCDNKMVEESSHEFIRLGFGEPMPISALHGYGIGNLLDNIFSQVKDKQVLEIEPDYKVSIVGRPNVGKSTLMNILMRKKRSIVSDVAGTTREAISEAIKFSNSSLLLTDTAGIRKKKKVDDDLESIMVKSSLKSLRDSDIVVLVIDSTECRLVDQELKLLFYAQDQKKCVILLFNKVDLISPDQRHLLEYQLKEYDFILNKVHKLWISCKEMKNIGKINKTIEKIWSKCKQEFTAEELDKIVVEQIAVKPMYKSEQQLKVKKIRSLDGKVPTFKVAVNRPQFFGPDQLGFIENVLRKNFDLQGCPVKLWVKKG